MTVSMMASFWGSLQIELLNRQSWKTTHSERIEKVHSPKPRPGLPWPLVPSWRTLAGVSTGVSGNANHARGSGRSSSTYESIHSALSSTSVRHQG